MAGRLPLAGRTKREPTDHFCERTSALADEARSCLAGATKLVLCHGRRKRKGASGGGTVVDWTEAAQMGRLRRVETLGGSKSAVIPRAYSLCLPRER